MGKEGLIKTFILPRGPSKKPLHPAVALHKLHTSSKASFPNSRERKPNQVITGVFIFFLDLHMSLRREHRFWKGEGLHIHFVSLRKLRNCRAGSLVGRGGERCTHVIGWEGWRHLIGYREVHVERNALSDRATAGESQKPVHECVAILKQTNRNYFCVRWNVFVNRSACIFSSNLFVNPSMCNCKSNIFVNCSVRICKTLNLFPRPNQKVRTNKSKPKPTLEVYLERRLSTSNEKKLSKCF